LLDGPRGVGDVDLVVEKLLEPAASAAVVHRDDDVWILFLKKLISARRKTIDGA
jgi:hypothetical protein